MTLRFVRNVQMMEHEGSFMKKTSLWLIAGVLAVGALSIAIHPAVSIAATKAAPEFKVPGEAK